MDNKTLSDTELITMIADYMENGFLENIIDMFRHDGSLYLLVGELIQDERIRVRMGITALVEELSNVDPSHTRASVPGLLPLLKHAEPHLRGDAANLLGIIGDPAALSSLEKAAADENQSVRLLVQEAIEEITGKNI